MAQFGYATVKALSQDGVQAARNLYPEQSALVIEASFFDTGGEGFVPQTLAYQVDDVASGESLVPLTTLTAAASLSVVITAGQNDMVSTSQPSETHRVLFKLTDADGQSYFAECMFDIYRLFGARDLPAA